MPQIDISDRLFREIQRHAIPLVDTVETTLARILAEYARTSEDGPDEGPKRYDPRMPPVLLHTTVTSAKVDGQVLPSAETFWNNVYIAAIKKVAARGISPATIADCISSNKHVGKKTDNGYKYVEEVGLSFQGLDANKAYSAIYNFAQMTGVGVDITFRWQNKEGVERPNEMGRLVIDTDPKKVSGLKRIDDARS